MIIKLEMEVDARTIVDFALAFIKTEADLSKELDALKVQVTRITGLKDSMASTIVGVADAFASRKDDPVAIQALRDELAGDADGLDATQLSLAALANTTAAPLAGATGGAQPPGAATPPASGEAAGTAASGTDAGGTKPGEGG